MTFIAFTILCNHLFPLGGKETWPPVESRFIEKSPWENPGGSRRPGIRQGYRKASGSWVGTRWQGCQGSQGVGTDGSSKGGWEVRAEMNSCRMASSNCCCSTTDHEPPLPVREETGVPAIFQGDQVFGQD